MRQTAKSAGLAHLPREGDAGPGIAGNHEDEAAGTRGRLESGEQEEAFSASSSTAASTTGSAANREARQEAQSTTSTGGEAHDARALFAAQAQVVKMLSQSSSHEQALLEVCREIESRLPGCACAVLLYQVRTHSLRVVAAPSLPPVLRQIGDVPVEPEGPSCAAACFHGRPVITEDAARQSLFAGFVHLATEYRGCLSLPIREPGVDSDRGRILGVLDCYCQDRRRLDDDTVAAAKAAATLAGAVFCASRQQTSLHLKRLHDPITDLPSRRLFADRLHGFLENERPLPAEERSRLLIAALDIDGFRDVNDTLGFQVGDLLLRAVADRLRVHLLEETVVARSGGDEFLLLLRGRFNEDEILEEAQRLAQRLNQPYDFGGHGLYVSISVGISVYPWDGEDAQTLLRHAESALQTCKEQGGGSFALYRPSFARHRPTVERWFQETRLVSQLRDALARGEIELHYQLKHRTADSRPYGAEALLRWHHPELGLLLPDAFLDVAEKHGYMQQIGEWAIRETCAQAKLWMNLGLEDIVVSVNVSPTQFRRGNFHRVVQAALQETELPPGNLEIELIERLAMEDTRPNQGRLQALRDLGIGISIDDFGTGFSSLGYLNSFEFDALKIDRSFIGAIGGGGDRDRDNRNIVLAILSMANNLSLKVVAEGVETPAQLDFLREHGCAYVQGFLFGMPKPAGEITQLLLLHRPIKKPRTA